MHGELATFDFEHAMWRFPAMEVPLYRWMVYKCLFHGESDLETDAY